MNTATHLTRSSSLTIPSLIRPLARHLGRWLAAMRSSLHAEARPATAAALTGTLDKGRTFWVEQPMLRDIHCLEGTLWLTQDGVGKDIILQAGESHRCDSASRLAIHALDAGRFTLA
ncbi:MAG: DUF2917 domain-containing protein [Burkholderiaceae bacterium]|nr:DUF2917 domain-containing protein [Burkholderiaceae bacterium]